MIGRLKPGVSLAQGAESGGCGRAPHGEEYPVTDKGIGIRVVPEVLPPNLLL